MEKFKNGNSQLIMIYLMVMFFTSLNAQSVNKAPIQEGISESRAKVREIYTSQIGIREKQPNSGPAVEEYLRYVNLPKGNPWCAAFVCWVYGQAGVGNPRSGWSPDLFKGGRIIWGRGESRIKSQDPRHLPSAPIGFSSEIKQNNRAAIRCAYPPGAASEWLQPGGGAGGGFRNNLVPTTGDIFGLYFPEKARIAHVGFIDQWDGTWLITVEGNTNEAGSREGDGVYRKKRLVRTVYKVARYIE